MAKAAANDRNAPEKRHGPGQWLALLLALAILLIAVVRSDRSQWPGIVGDEATYVMAAQSLAWDFDFRYSKKDYDRFVKTMDEVPDGLILQSADNGKTLVFAKPLYYPLYVAPFLRVAGLEGVLVANWFLLALASLFAAFRLSERVGRSAPLWVAVLLFGSVTFAHVFWVHADLFLFCLVLIAFSLCLDLRRGEEGRAVGWQAALGIVLLAVVALSRPFYATLFLPVVLFNIGRNRSLRRLLLPAAALVLLSLTFDLSVRGAPSSYSGERQGYYSYTGFPEVDGAQEWRQSVAERGTNSWTGKNLLPFGFDLRQFAWNNFYLIAGRHVGLLPYFLPVFLCLLAYRPGEVRTTILLSIMIGVAAFLIVRPFNFFGGGGALANRYFLPFFAATWFIVGRPLKARWLAIALALCAPFLWHLWLNPNAFLKAPDGRYSYVTPQAERFLPHETTQSHLKPSGKEDFQHGDFWIKPLTPNLTPLNGGAIVRWRTDRNAQWLVGSEIPLRDFRMRLTAQDPNWQGPAPQLRGAVTKGETLVADSGLELLFSSRRPQAKHPMWWTDEDVYLYHFALSTAAKNAEDTALPVTLDFVMERVWPEAQVPLGSE